MASIIAYRKHITRDITRELRLPEDPTTRERLGAELATLDGITYVALPDGVTLPADQPAEIAASVQAVTPDAALRARIKDASPHVALISARMQEQIRALYSAEDEMYFARIGTGAALNMYQFEPGEAEALTLYGEHVEAIRQWGRSERAKFGL